MLREIRAHSRWLWIRVALITVGWAVRTCSRPRQKQVWSRPLTTRRRRWVPIPWARSGAAGKWPHFPRPRLGRAGPRVPPEPLRDEAAARVDRPPPRLPVWGHAIWPRNSRPSALSGEKLAFPLHRGPPPVGVLHLTRRWAQDRPGGVTRGCSRLITSLNSGEGKFMGSVEHATGCKLAADKTSAPRMQPLGRQFLWSRQARCIGVP